MEGAASGFQRIPKMGRARFPRAKRALEKAHRSIWDHFGTNNRMKARNKKMDKTCVNPLLAQLGTAHLTANFDGERHLILRWCEIGLHGGVRQTLADTSNMEETYYLNQI